MLNSAINFALGFFGHPLEGKYQQSITIEADGASDFTVSYPLYLITFYLVQQYFGPVRYVSDLVGNRLDFS